MRFCPVCRLPYPEADRTVCIVDGATLVERAGGLEGALLGGRYRVDRVLGEGGMARVYLGHATAIDQPVAIKVMHTRLAADAELRERFRREARNAASLAHENVIEIYDFGETDSGEPYLVMELLEGGTLKDVVQSGPIPLPRMLALGLGIARGLARAHDLGVIHRDLKPENVFVCPRGGGEIAKLVDFGIARARHESRLTAAGSLIGTPAYIAPERVRGHENDPSSDLYSLGVVFFEMITGRLPFLSNDIPGFLLQHLEETPPSPGSLAPTCTTMLESLILRLLEKEPGRRPVDAHQVVRELEAMAASLGRVARADLGPTLPPEPRPSLSAPVTLERWEQRTIMLEQMLLRAYPEGAPRALMTSLDDLRDTVVRLDGLRRTASVRQRERDIVQERLPEVRGRLGHAVHALGADLSTEREALRKLRLEVEEREAKVADLEMQIAELRAHLTEEETKADTFGAAAEQELASMGVEIERLRLSAAETTRSLLTVLRTHPACASLVRDFA